MLGRRPPLASTFKLTAFLFAFSLRGFYPALAFAGILPGTSCGGSVAGALPFTAVTSQAPARFFARSGRIDRDN